MPSENPHREQRSVPVLYYAGSSNPALEYLHLKPENPEDTEALQTLPEILRLKKEQPTAYEIEAAALLSLLWCRLLRTHPMMPDGNTAVSQDPDLLIQRDMVSIFTATTVNPSIWKRSPPPEKSAAINAVRFSAAIFARAQLIF